MLLKVGPLAQFINEEAIHDGFDKENSFHFNTNEEAIKILNQIVQKEDIVLVKASHGMHFEEIVKKLVGDK